MKAENPEKLIGSIFAEKYAILAVVGSGAMSTVYKASHNLIRRVVAIKLLHAAHLQDETTIKRFKQEAVALSHLSHPNLVTAFDFGLLPEGQPYLVMDFVEGQSLEKYLDQEGAKDAPWVIAVAIQICRALAHAHKFGVLHRDLKPANIILLDTARDEITLKVVDFGLATFLPEAPLSKQPLTQPTEVPGSPLYMSPEQCRGIKLDARSDIYSLGVVMYEALTGLPPLVGDDWVETMRKQVFTKPIPPSAIHPLFDIPKPLEDIVLKCLKKDPNERFSSLPELENALQSLEMEKSQTIKLELASATRHTLVNPTQAILVVEDQDLQRNHLIQLLRVHIPASINICEATCGAQALSLVDSLAPIMVITDISMPEMSGITLAQKIWDKYPTTKILFWSQYHREIYVRELGRIVPDEAIHGYALKTSSDERLVYAILSILVYDNPYLDPVVRAVQKQISSQNLTNDEFDTIVKLSLGLTDRAMATHHRISITGIKSRIISCATKLLTGISKPDQPFTKAFELHNRLIFEAIKRGLIDQALLQKEDNELHDWLCEEFDWH